MIVLRNSKIRVTASDDVAKVFQDLLKLEDPIDQEKEHFYVMHLDARNQIKLVELVAMGIQNQAMIHPRETYRRAVTEGATSVIVAHNHPSGDTTPSDEDIRVTKQLHEAGSVLGIPMLDHIVFTETDYFSFQKNE
jgi:DNA repair protein RadC